MFVKPIRVYPHDRHDALEQGRHGGRYALAGADLEIEAWAGAGLHLRRDPGGRRNVLGDPGIVEAVGRQGQVGRIEHGDAHAPVLQRGAGRRVDGRDAAA